METTHGSKTQEIAALVQAGIAYWTQIYPLARREIKHWKRHAATIPNATLRAQATYKLTGERLNPEAAAFFAVLAPRHQRPRLVRLIVAFQIAYDYLDALNEAPDTASLANGLSLHQALTDAVSLSPGKADYYRHHPHKDDGGYLHDLIAACHSVTAELPASVRLRPLLISAVRRCGEAQCRNHAVQLEGSGQLVRWTETQAANGTYLWWELAAGGISSLAIHALFAASAADATAEEAQRIDAAYFPPVCAISALLDSLIDQAHDIETANHSFTAHYPTPALAAKRYAQITTEAHDLMQPLRHSRRHIVILAGIASFYLSAQEARFPPAQQVAKSTLESLGPSTRLILAVMCLMRRSIQIDGT